MDKEHKIKTENDLANFIVGQLQNDGWTCYEEVMPHRGGQIADIVAVKSNYVRVIETKMSFSLALIEQAHHWTFYAHSVYVASYRWRGTVNGKLKGYSRPKGYWAFEHLCRHLGIGILTVQEYDNLWSENTFQITEIPSQFKRKILPDLRNALCDEMLANGNAGTSGGQHWTPFKKTCAELLKVVEKNPGILFKDAISQIQHHYQRDSTAIACLSRGIFDGFVKGVKIVNENRRNYLYPISD